MLRRYKRLEHQRDFFADILNSKNQILDQSLRAGNRGQTTISNIAGGVGV
jgi:hypothetical protein